MPLLQHVVAAHTGVSTDFTRTLTTGLKRLALVCMQQEGATANAFTATLDGVTMTPIAGPTGQVASAGNSQHLSWFILLAGDIGTGDVTLTTESSGTEDNTSVHFFLFDDISQTTTLLDVAVDFAAGTTNPKSVTLNAGGNEDYIVIGMAGNGNNVDYSMTFNGNAPDSGDEVDNNTTTTGSSAVWGGQSASGGLTLAATSTPAPNRSAFVGIMLAADASPPGRTRNESITQGPSAIFLSDRYLETRLLSPGNYQAVITCTINRLCTVLVEIFTDDTVVDTEELVLGILNDVTENTIPFSTTLAHQRVKTGLSSVTGNTANGVLFSFDSEIQTSTGESPEEEGVI